ncbi:MAG TPA: SUF system NifU family Fe-S cluster assembly protein [Candidatus Hydrogenedentes bacterium]|nr:SUF system NifU family Fe-S cluster assembly protein [Candidatus Hydrogenedentota bacterium]HRK34424.1 SUF system NifU family Fe-S cluster assembly protein [Candidatus Hydrogenedentota bacterium]
MAPNRALYEQVILEHNKKPRNFREMPDATNAIEGYNPLCGDHFTIYVKMNGDIVEDISFAGAGCAISKSSASVMTTLIKGKTKSEAEALFASFHKLVTSPPDVPVDEEKAGRLAVFAGVREFPVRIKCATLAWHTLLSALDGKAGSVSTE